MKSLFIGKLACDDSFLQASKVLNSTNIRETVEAALTFTPFTVAQLNLVKAKIGEQYFPSCVRLGYSTGFFREYTVCTLFSLTLGANNTPAFDGIYIPFSGEIILLPYDICEFNDAVEENCDAEFAHKANEQTGKRFFRRFKVELKAEKTSFPQNIKQKFLGNGSETRDIKTIASLTATADISINTKTENKEETHDPMYFLYNEVK